MKKIIARSVIVLAAVMFLCFLFGLGYGLTGSVEDAAKVMLGIIGLVAGVTGFIVLLGWAVENY